VSRTGGSSNEEKGTKRSVYAALIANLLIAVSKFVAGIASGSAALLAEGAHSVADTVNQVFLLISLPLSKTAPDRDHPYGHGKDRFLVSDRRRRALCRRCGLLGLRGYLEDYRRF